MAKPQSRQELILSTYRHHDRLEAAFKSLGDAAETGHFDFKGRDQNVRDVFVQLAAWQKMYLDWSKANLTGEAKRFMPKPYTWSTAGKLSRKIWQQNQTTTLQDAHKAFDSLYNEMLAQYEQLTNEQLFLKHFYPWTGSLALGEVASMVSDRHYAWATKVLARFHKQLQSVD